MRIAPLITMCFAHLIRYDHMLKRCLRVVDRTVRRMRRHGMFRTPVDVAIGSGSPP